MPAQGLELRDHKPTRGHVVLQNGKKLPLLPANTASLEQTPARSRDGAKLGQRRPHESSVGSAGG